jgi:hypothetical protein
MAVREFDGIDDLITCAIGGLSAMAYGTAAAIIAPGASGAWRGICNLHNSGGSVLASPLALRDLSNRPAMFTLANSSLTTFNLTAGTWYLIVARKATGTAAPRFSIRDMSTGIWSHGVGGTALADWTAPGASGTVRFNNANSSDWFNGKVVVRAAWSNSLPWSADTTGDAAIEAAGLHTAAQNWLDNSPDAMWRFNQAEVATAVEDDTGGGADQTAIAGTTVVTGDDPPDFDFSLGGAPAAPSLYVVTTNLRLN